MFKSKSEMSAEGLHKSFHSVGRKMANRCCYGYGTAPGGKLVINESGAKIVRWIFDRYLIGGSLGKIAAGLVKQDVLSPTRKSKWNRETISKLLSNEKYTDSVLLQKTMSFAGAQFRNDGELDQMLIKGHHEAIIFAADFKRVQRIKNERSKSQTQNLV